MLIGYARVSTDDQSLALQLDSLRQSGCERIFQDKISGTKLLRPNLDKVLDFARSGDTLVVWRLDRLSRSLRDLIETVAMLESRGVQLRSLQESIDTTTSNGKLVFHLFGALAEFERNLIRERTAAGLQAACARGRRFGRPPALDNEMQRRAVELYEKRNLTVREICELMKISKPTLYKYVKAERQKK